MRNRARCGGVRPPRAPGREDPRRRPEPDPGAQPAALLARAAGRHHRPAGPGQIGSPTARVRIGALCTHAQIERSPDVARAPAAARGGGAAYRAPRDPQPRHARRQPRARRSGGGVAGVRARARRRVRDRAAKAGERRVTARDFFKGAVRDRPRPGEMLTASRFRPGRRNRACSSSSRAARATMRSSAWPRREADGGALAEVRLAFFGAGGDADARPRRDGRGEGSKRSPADRRGASRARRGPAPIGDLYTLRAHQAAPRARTTGRALARSPPEDATMEPTITTLTVNGTR